MTSTAVILVGGVGKRLGTLTKKTPKPLIQINGNYFLNFLIERSEFISTIKTSPSFFDLEIISICPECIKSKQPFVNTIFFFF